MITLDSPIATVLGGVKQGKPRGSKLTRREALEERLGLRTVGDLLHHLPRRYLRTGELADVEQLVEGDLLTVLARVVSVGKHTYADRRTGRPAYRVEVAIDAGVPLVMTFFAKASHTADYFARRLAVGAEGVFVGRVGRFRDTWQLTNPEMVLFGRGEAGEGEAISSLEVVGELFPIYPLTQGWQTWELQRVIATALGLVEEIPDALPTELAERRRLPGARTTLEWLHTPRDLGQVEQARRRLRYEEALVTQLVLARRRRAVAATGAQARDGGDGALLAAFDERLPFELTAGQRAIGEEIAADLARPVPMNRLLQGEVGSGKTLVALRAMLRVVDSGGQAALLAPTEVLAQQHHRSITAMLGDLAEGGRLGSPPAATRVELLTGSMTKTQRREPLLRLASGEAGIVVGTHALLEDAVGFADLGLVVVDEQHRFGVEQRAALTDKAGTPPHVLVMTATPIPRTVAMTVFGDLEVSTLRELPAGRAPIQTTVVPTADAPHWMERVWARVREEVSAGHQVYVVCPRITGDDAEVDDLPEDLLPVSEDDAPAGRGAPATQPRRALHAVEEVAASLVSGPLAGLRVGVLHGRLAPEVKDAAMRAFADGETDVLVATTVIEVGVDVPNATTMVLLDADRFGISQLHQLRGRVGRGGLPGLCLLVSDAERGTAARERLDAVAATTDGFALSRTDLELRREGDVLGRSQSGWRSGLQNLRVLRDEATIVAAREDAVRLLDADPDLAGAPLLAERVRALEESVASEFMEKA